MINIREGGLAIYGAVIAAVVVVYFFSKYKKIDFRDLDVYKRQVIGRS